MQSPDLTRRHFAGGLAAATAALALPFPVRLLGSLPGTSPPTIAVQPFPLSQVRLLPGPFLEACQVNRRFLMELDPERLLHMFRVTAGVPSSALPLGGWESPVNELRGHYTGHYLSACAQLSASLGDGAVRQRGDLMVEELAQCQRALGSGYLSAFPEDFFDRLRDGKQVWAPFYTLHKLMAGLLDMHQIAGNRTALEVVTGMAAWVGRWARPLGDAHMQRVLEREYGGMNEVLYNLAAATDDPSLFELAHHFDHERVFAPLAEGRDELKGLHVNTTIPKIIGAARRYELTGEPRYRAIAEFFYREVVGRRAYCTGGTSNGEVWGADPGILATELSGYTEESCVTYNMIKLAAHIYRWTAEPACADYIERALWNGILGTQHPRDGSKLYYLPLAAGYWKLFGTPLADFWCCTGSGSESFSRFGEHIYAHDNGLYVNQFIASQLDWPERGLRAIQTTRLPEEGHVELTLETQRPQRLALWLRVPAWATRGGVVVLNGKELEGFASPSSYVVLDRTWKDGDRLELRLPLALRSEPLPDDPAMTAFLYGPVVLAGRLGTAGLTSPVLRAAPTKPRTVPEYAAEPVPAPTLHAASQEPSSWIRRGATQPLEFRTTGQKTDITLVPLSGLFDERFAVYWRLERPTT